MSAQFRLREITPKLNESNNPADYPAGSYVCVLHIAKQAQPNLVNANVTYSACVLEYRNSISGPTEWTEVPIFHLKK